jgi:DNA processing protein
MTNCLPFYDHLITLRGDDMDKLTYQLVQLHHCSGITWRHLERLCSIGPIEDVTEINTLIKQLHLNKDTATLVRDQMSQFSTTQLIERYKQSGIHIISMNHPLYPPSLKHIYEPPPMLYVKGNLQLLQSPIKLAIVGARVHDPYGVQALKTLIPELVEKNVCIVSGLARGIDRLAHEITINYGGKTIGVIAGGLYHIYPKEHYALADKMAQEHLLISEYPPIVSPKKWHFPKRNRIISGLSRGVLVVQARERSGSLITADYALDQGRDVFAIPGPITSPLTAGTHLLIQQGAKLVHSPQDIFDEWFY